MSHMSCCAGPPSRKNTIQDRAAPGRKPCVAALASRLGSVMPSNPSEPACTRSRRVVDLVGSMSLPGGGRVETILGVTCARPSEDSIGHLLRRITTRCFRSPGACTGPALLHQGSVSWCGRLQSGCVSQALTAQEQARGVPRATDTAFSRGQATTFPGGRCAPLAIGDITEITGNSTSGLV